MALSMLTVAARPADEIHAFGYSKAEYFSSGLEGALILLAAATVTWTAVPRLFAPQPLEQLGIGLTVSVLASAVNFGVARVLMNAGKEYRSITLEADAHHLMTDVWTSAGVVLGVGIVALTEWLRLDPLIALIVAANILRTGWQLLSRSIRGLLDAALPAARSDQTGPEPVRITGHSASCAKNAPSGNTVVYFSSCLGAGQLECPARARSA
jgi:cation diffusion facilitator family transporter